MLRLKSFFKVKFRSVVLGCLLYRNRHNQCLRQHTNRDTDTLAPRGHGRPQASRTPNAASDYTYSRTELYFTSYSRNTTTCFGPICGPSSGCNLEISYTKCVGWGERMISRYSNIGCHDLGFFLLLCEFSQLLSTYVGDYFYGYVTSRFYRLSTVVVEQCFRRVCIPTVLSEIQLCSTVRVIHKSCVLLYQYNGDDTPQNFLRRHEEVNCGCVSRQHYSGSEMRWY